MVRGGGSSLHQCKGAPCSREGALGLSPSSQGAFCSSVLRQHHRDQLFASSRRDSVSEPQHGSSASPSLGRGSGDSSLSPICHGETQRGGGCPVPFGSGFGFGVDPAPGCFRLSEEVVASDGGSFCCLTESPLLKNTKKPVYSQSTNPCKAILLEYVPTF